MSAAARTLSLIDLCDLSEDAAHKMPCGMRWSDDRWRPDLSPLQAARSSIPIGVAGCSNARPATGSSRRPAELRSRAESCRFGRCLWLSACSSTPPRASAVSQLSRYLGLHAKTAAAFVLPCAKLRCALTANFATTRLCGVVEIDGGWFRGHVRPENHRPARVDRRRRQHQSGKRRCVVVMRQRGGPTVTAVVKHETEAVLIIRRRVARGSIVHADEARAWDDLHATFENEADQSSGSRQQRWRLHEPGRKLYLPVATRGDWSASPYRRASSLPVCRRNGVARRHAPRWPQP